MRPVWWLLRDLTLPSLRRHRLRTALTVIGVVLGVQLFATIRLIDRATLQSFEHTITTLAGEADVQLTNSGVGVPEDLVERIAAVPGVASASALLRGTLQTQWGALTVFGVDLFADQRLRETQFPRRHVHLGDELRFANAADSIALARPFAERAGLAADARFEAIGPSGKSTLVVRGSLDPIGPAMLFGGAVGLVDLPTAERLLVREGRVDEIDIALAATADRPATIARLEAVTAGVGVLLDRDARGGVSGLLGGLRIILGVTSILGLTVGSLLVHHAMRSAILQRRRSFAIVRALGYRRRVVAAAIVTEAVVLGVVGGAIGMLLAVPAARAAIDLVTAAIGEIWARTDHATITFELADGVLAVALGGLSAAFAAAGPAATAAELEIVAQLRATSERRRVGITRSSVAFGLGLCLVAAACLWWQSVSASTAIQLLLILAGFSLMTFGYAALAPLVLVLFVTAIRWLAPRRALGLRLALGQLAHDPVRTRGTLGALMAAFAFVLCVRAFVASLGSTIVTWVHQVIAADLLVGASPALPLPVAPTLPRAIEPELRAIPGVERVAPTRLVLATIAGKTAALRAQAASDLRVRPFPVVDHVDGYVDAFARGEAAIVSDNLAYRLGLHAGDTVALDSPTGRRAFRVGAIVLDYTMDIGTFMVDIDAFERWWRDALVTSFLVYLQPDADRAAVRAAIVERFAGRFPLAVLTGDEFERNITDAIDGAFVLTYAIELVAAVIAGVGVLNFFLAEILDRRREIGMLRTVALDRRQLLRDLTGEAMLIGACGGMLAIAWGWPIARVIVTHSTRLVSGWQLAFAFPWPMALAMPAVVAGTAAAAAWIPVRATMREPLTRLVGIES